MELATVRHRLSQNSRSLRERSRRAQLLVPGALPTTKEFRYMTKRVIARVVGSIITGVITIAALFFGILGVVALVTKQDYTTVMNAAFEWLKGLSNK